MTFFLRSLSPPHRTTTTIRCFCQEGLDSLSLLLACIVELHHEKLVTREMIYDDILLRFCYLKNYVTFSTFRSLLFFFLWIFFPGISFSLFYAFYTHHIIIMLRVECKGKTQKGRMEKCKTSNKIKIICFHCVLCIKRGLLFKYYSSCSPPPTTQCPLSIPQCLNV
jgi:hypothetical protein